MSPSYTLLESGNNLNALLEWFVASVALIAAVTFFYVFVLNRSPSPEELTQAKLESIASTRDVSQILSSAQDALGSGDTNRAVELSVKVVSISMENVLRRTGINLEEMNVSDMAYLAQTRASSSPDIAQHAYQLNLLLLKAAQSQRVTQQEAEWATSTAGWISQLVLSGQIIIQ